jgi:hypothetical protein
VNTPAKLAGFAVTLAAIFGGGLAAGQVVGPRDGADGGQDAMAHGDASHSAQTADGDDEREAATAVPKGLMVSQDGYSLRPATTGPLRTGHALFSFTILGLDGRAVREYTPTHDKDLHLIVVRRDLTGFQHLHPVLGATGPGRFRWRWPSRACTGRSPTSPPTAGVRAR